MKLNPYLQKNDINNKLLIIFFILILILISNTAFAQTNNNNEEGNQTDTELNQFRFRPTLNVGSFVVNSEPYMTIEGLFEFGYEKFAAGVRIDIQINAMGKLGVIGPDGKITIQNWDTLSDIITKIAYISYGRKGDEFYLKYGPIESLTFGNGTILKDFTTTHLSPIYRRNGFIFDAELGYLGLQTLISDFITGPIMGIRFFMRPFIAIETALPFLRNMVMGVTYVYDSDPDHVLAKDGRQAKEYILQDAGHAVSELGFDVAFELVNNPKALSMMLSADYNFMFGLGMGLHIRFYGSIVPDTVDLEYNIESIISFNSYVQSFFDSSYYGIRSTKYKRLRDNNSTDTLFGMKIVLAKEFFKDEDNRYVRVSLSAADVFGDNFGGDWELGYIMYGFVPNLNFDIYFHVWDAWKFSHLFANIFNKEIKISLGYTISKVYISLSYIRSYIYDETILDFTPLDIFQIETKVSF